MKELTTNELRETTGGGIFAALLIGAAFLWGAANFVKDVIVNGEKFDVTEW